MNTLLFDLDGTLLPMDQEQFIHEYFSLLGKKAASLGYDPHKTIKAIWAGTEAMVKNDGTMSNRERFWKTFSSLSGYDAHVLEPAFDSFYANEFNAVQSILSPNPYPRLIIQCAKSKGYRLLLATNPLFPDVATKARIHWAGLDTSDFDFITTYDNSRYCKPNPDYYRTLLATVSISPDTVMMIGNDTAEDIVPAASLGMHTYLVTDHAIFSSKSSITPEHTGSLQELLTYMQSLPACI